jgi:hypothetical protein
MKKGTPSAVACQWPLLKAKLAKGTAYATGNPFNYRYQLRIKSTPAAAYYTFWDYDQCAESGQFQVAEGPAWDQLMLELERKGIRSIPCVGVGVSVWNEHPVLLRLERKPAVALDAVNRALRAQPQTVRRDLQANGLYGYTAMACDTSKIFIFGLPVGFAVRERLAQLPMSWACAVWFGPTAAPFYREAGGEERIYHTVLVRGAAISLMTEHGGLRFFQQDRAVMEGQPILQSSLAKLRSVYSYFPKGQIVHQLYPLEVSLTWANTLRKGIQFMNCAAEVRIVAVAKLKFPGIADEVGLQDMFPGGTPWNVPGTLQRYQTLKLQMPLLELTQATTGDVVEPFPVKAAQWIKASRAAFVAGILALAGSLALAGWSAQELAGARQQLKGGHRIQTEAALQRAARIQEALQKRGLPQALKKGRFLTAAEAALKTAIQWQLRVGPGPTVTVQFTLGPEQDFLDVLTSLDKVFSEMGWERQRHEELGNYQHAVAYRQ